MKELNYYTNFLLLRFSKLPLWKSLLILCLGIICGMVILGMCTIFFGEEEADSFTKSDSFLNDFVWVCVVAPFVETFAIYLMIKFVNWIIPKWTILQVIVPTIIFGLIHSQSALYMVNGLLLGFVFALGFCAYYHYRGFTTAFISIMLVHSFRNLCGILSIFYS